MLAYKGFNNDWSCQGFKYEFGKNYVHNGELILKKSGFHSSPNPMYILNHYQPYKGAKFAIVDIRGKILDYNEIYISSEIELIQEMTFDELFDFWLNRNPDLSQIDLEGQTFMDIAKKHNLTLIIKKLEEIKKWN